MISSIDLYCHLLRGEAAVFDKSLARLLLLLVSRFPRVRKMTATKLYETLLTLTDVAGASDCRAAALLAANQDEILAVLSDTDWDDDVEALKPVRNRLRVLFGLDNVAIPSAASE